MEVTNLIKISAFFVSVGFSLILIGLASAMIIRNDDVAVWVPVLIGVTNLWIPSPINLIHKPKASGVGGLRSDLTSSSLSEPRQNSPMTHYSSI